MTSPWKVVLSLRHTCPPPPLFNASFCLLCCSAVVLGTGELGLEPVLGGEEAVPGQHRDQPHDLWPLPHAHQAEHRGPQGKRHTNAKTCMLSAVCLMDRDLFWASLCCWFLRYCSYCPCACHYCVACGFGCCNLIRRVSLIDAPDPGFLLEDNVSCLSNEHRPGDNTQDNPPHSRMHNGRVLCRKTRNFIFGALQMKSCSLTAD